MEDIWACVGIVIAVTHTDFFGIKNRIKWEWLLKLLSCPICLGFWTYLIMILLREHVLDWKTAFFCSIVSYAVSTLLNLAHSMTARNLK